MNPSGMNRGGRPVKIDPHSDKFAFFKDNIRDEEESFDPHVYYYNRQEKDHAHVDPRQPVYPSVKKPEPRREDPQLQAHHKPAYQQQLQQQQYQQQQYQQYQQHHSANKPQPQQQQPQQRHVQHVPVSPAKQNPNPRSAMMYNTQPVANSQPNPRDKILKEDISPINLNTSSGSLANPNASNVLPNTSLPQQQSSLSNSSNNIAMLQSINVNNSPLINNNIPLNSSNSNIPMNILNPPSSSLSSSFNNLNISSNSIPSNSPSLNVSTGGLNSSSGNINLNNLNNINPPIVSPIAASTSTSTTTTSSTTTSPNINLNSNGNSSEDQYDLLGLLKVLKMTNLNLNILAFGTDLTTLGLNLSSTEVLYNSFASPYSATPLKQEPDHIIPECYFINPALSVPTDKMNLFSDETLFYIFYGMPNDVLQVAAAVELAARDWSYHTELRVWFQRLPGTTPLVKALNYETGSYIYFDIHQWKDKTKTNFQMEYDKLYSPKT